MGNRQQTRQRSAVVARFPPQVILGWLTADGAVHERVATRRIRATLSPAAYLASVDAPAAALLLGKRVVLEAARTGAWADKAVCGQLRAAIGADSILTKDVW